MILYAPRKKFMFKLKLFSTFLASLATVGIFSFSTQTFAQGTVNFYNENIMTALNHTRGGGEGDPIDADPGNVIEFRIVALNASPDTIAENVNVKASIPATPTRTLVASATVSASNGAAITDTATVRLVSGSDQGFEYVPGHVRIFSNSCPDGCFASDEIVNGGVSVGNLAYNESAQVFFKAFVTNVVVDEPSPSPSVAPSPSPSIVPSPSPSVVPSVVPSPTGNVTQTVSCPDGRSFTVEAGQNANANVLCQQQQQDQTQTQTNTQTNNQNQTVTATGGSSSSSSSSTSNPTINITTTNPATPQVLGTSTVRVAGVKELPKTGLPLIAWIGAAFIPAGLKLGKSGKGKGERVNESANYIWENREFKK